MVDQDIGGKETQLSSYQSIREKRVGAMEERGVLQEVDVVV